MRALFSSADTAALLSSRHAYTWRALAISSGRAAAPGSRCRTWRRSPSVSACRVAPPAARLAPWPARPLPRGTPRSPPGNFAGVSWPAPFPLPRTRGVPRAVRTPTRQPRFHPLLSDVEVHLALDDVEGLVLVAMHVVGRGEPGRHDVIDEAEGASGLLAGRLH